MIWKHNIANQMRIHSNLVIWPNDITPIMSDFLMLFLITSVHNIDIPPTSIHRRNLSCPEHGGISKFDCFILIHTDLHRLGDWDHVHKQSLDLFDMKFTAFMASRKVTRQVILENSQQLRWCSIERTVDWIPLHSSRQVGNVHPEIRNWIKIINLGRKV